MALAWAAFLVSAAVVFVASRGLVKAGDQVAERTGISRTFIGLLLLATATSMPEVATGASAVGIVGSVDLAAGDIFGSNLFNLMIIALLDLSYRDHVLLTTVNLNTLLPATLSGLIIGLAFLFILLHVTEAPVAESLSLVFTPALLAFYVLAMFLLWRRESPGLQTDPSGAGQGSAPGLKGPLLLYGVSVAVIVAAGLGLASSGEQIAELTGWGSSFVGSLFVAMSTSLPEVATSFAALRIGARDMAIANLVGSNLFNTGVVPFTDDLVYPQGLVGGFLGSVSSIHLVTALITIGMTGVVMAGLMLRPRRKRLGRLTPEAIALLALFLLAHYLVFTAGPVK